MDYVIDESNINITVNNGVVFIKGHVDAYWKKLEVESIVFRTKGVRGLTNELAVLLSEDKEDKEIAEKIIHYIKKNLLAKVDQINVTVNDSKVILAGCVPNWQVYFAVFDKAIYTNGVKSVVNTMKIIPEGCQRQ